MMPAFAMLQRFWFALLLIGVASTPVAGVASEDLNDSDDPPVPLYQTGVVLPTKSVRVALVDSGVNYLLPVIYQSLARTASGELIGYDFWDMDERPFDAHPAANGVVKRHGTQTASLLLREAEFVELVPYRYPRPDMSRMQQLLAHADQHNVRIVGLPLGGNRPDQWTAFEDAAMRYPHILFIASAGNNNRDIDLQPVYPASLLLPNLLVVTSADDFVRPAPGVNWGRGSVDYLVPAEMQRVVRFDGSEGVVSGSSYAVPRMAALAARLLRDAPELDAQGLLAEIRRRFATGTAPRKIGQGYVHDPRADQDDLIRISRAQRWPDLAAVDKNNAGKITPDQPLPLSLPLDVLILDSEWTVRSVSQTLSEAQQILWQCQLFFSDVQLRFVELPDYLKDLETGASKTLMDAVRLSGTARRSTVVFARDSQMNQPFEAEAFGRGNTRDRPWLTDSVWLTLALQDRGIGLAHELTHVLANSGRHSDQPGNLMLARTTGNNRNLSQQQCESLRESALEAGLAQSG